MPKEEVAILRQEVHLLREELVGMRVMLEGVTNALQGAQRAYAAVAQRADLLEARLDRAGQAPVAPEAEP